MFKSFPKFNGCHFLLVKTFFLWRLRTEITGLSFNIVVIIIIFIICNGNAIIIGGNGCNCIICISLLLIFYQNIFSC